MTIGKILENHQVNERYRKMRQLMTQISEQGFLQIWNEAIKQIDKFAPTTGDDILSQLMSLFAEVGARSILQMKCIVDQDETSYTLEDLANTLTHAIHAMLQTKEIKKIEKQFMPDDIKKLN